MKEIIETSADFAMSVQQGDLEIARDHLKISAWLVALSTAALYFCFTELEKLKMVSCSFTSFSLFAGYLIIANVFGFSFLAAYKFRHLHLQFCAYARNLIVAHKMQKATFIENMDRLKKPDPSSESVPFWALLQSGDLFAEFNKKGFNPIKDVTPKFEEKKSKMEYWAKKQRKAAFVGFIGIVVVKSLQAISQVIG